MSPDAVEILLAGLLVLVAGSGIAVCAMRASVAQVLMLGVHGLCLALLFLALRAPDVALAQIAVGSVIVPLMFLAAIANLHKRGVRQEEAEEEAQEETRQGARDG